jgi:hypothetical protein
MTNKPVGIFRQELSNSLEIVEREISQLATFSLAWQSLAVQLNKLLCDGSPTLVERVISNPLFHPMRKQIAPRTYLLHTGWRADWNENGVSMNCFDDTQSPIPLHQWLDQIILVSNGQDLTIRDVIRFPRNKEAAHSDPQEHAKIEAMKLAYNLTLGGKDYSSYYLTLAIVGAYIVPRIRQILPV